MDTLYIESFITTPNYYFSCLLSIPYGMLLAVLIVSIMTPLKKGNISTFGRNIMALSIIIITSTLALPSVSFQSLPSSIAKILVSGSSHEIEIKVNIIIFSLTACATLLLFILHELTVSTVIALQEKETDNESNTGTIVTLNREWGNKIPLLISRKAA